MFWDQGPLRDRIKKICDSFTGDRFDVPQNGQEIQGKIAQTEQEVKNAQDVLFRSRKLLRSQLKDFDNMKGAQNATSVVYIYKMFLAKEKILF